MSKVDTAGAENSLPPGLTFEQVEKAIEKSGYPLQIHVANELQPEFRIQPEWGFVDRNSEAMRAIDLLATRELFDWGEASGTRVRPHIVLLIECKRSDMPYIFFGDGNPGLGNFPHVAGLNHQEIVLKTNDDRSSWSLPIFMALGLDQEAFVSAPPANCSTLTKCVRKGSEVELSGTEAYQGLVLPLRSAVEHFRRTSKPPATAAYFDAYLVVGLAVLDAPMLTSHRTSSGSRTEFTPWQRLWRHEPLEADAFHSQFGESSAIDIVHRSYLSTYIEQHLLPFAETFAATAMKHATEVFSGKGFVKGLGANSRPADMESRLKPRKRGRSEP